jgi:SAM-dependent methyltransferase
MAVTIACLRAGVEPPVSVMLARLLWPLQTLALRQRWFVDAGVLLFVGIISGLAMPQVVAWSAFSQGQKIAVSGALLAIWYAAGRVGAVMGTMLAIGIGVLVALAGSEQSATGISLLIITTATLSLPLLYELRKARTQADALRASALTMVMIIPGAALLAPAWYLVGGLWLALGGAVTMLSCLVLPLSWCRLIGDEPALLLTPMLPQPRTIHIAQVTQVAVLVMVALGGVDVIAHAVNKPPPIYGRWLWIIPVVSMAIWHGITGQFLLAAIIVIVSMGWLGYAFLHREPWNELELLSAFTLSQILPVALWLARTRQRPWPSLLLITIGLLSAFAVPDLFMTIGGAALAGCLAVVVCSFRPLTNAPITGVVTADDALKRARQAFRRMPPYWRHYGTAKLRYDPVYRQLAEQTMPWGRILDAGCGPGLVAALAAARGEPSYLGIDLDREKLETAVTILDRLNKPLSSNWKLWQARFPLAQSLPDQFDSIFLLDVLHYWPEEEQALVLQQLRKSLAPSGKLWLRDGVSDGAGNTGTVGFSEAFTTYFGLNPSGSGLHFLSELAMRDLLERCGFTVVNCSPSGKENRLWCCVGRD